MKYIVLIWLLILPLSNSAQVVIDKNSVYRDTSGHEIKQQEFIKRMNTGKFRISSVKNDKGIVIGYQLISRGVIKPSKFPNIPLGEEISIDIIYHGHILLPVTLKSKTASEDVWMVYDTGTATALVDTSGFELQHGKPERLYIGGLQIENPPGSSGALAKIIGGINEKYSKEIPEKLQGKKISGVIGLLMLNRYSISIDLKNRKIHLRNKDNVQRTLLPKPPISEVSYRNYVYNIWFPLTINNQRGYAHLDTGYPFTWVEKTKFNKPISSYVVGRKDILEAVPFFDFKPLSQAKNYSGLPFTLIANMGNNLIENFILTIDSRDKKLFFEDNSGT